MSRANILWTSSYCIKGAVLFTQESILASQPYKNVSIFRNEIYDKSSKLNKIIEHDFPKEFDPFVAYMKKVSISVCSRYPEENPCNDSQYLVKGLNTIVVKIAENTREIMKELAKRRRNKPKNLSKEELKKSEWHKSIQKLLQNDKMQMTEFLLKHTIDAK